MKYKILSLSKISFVTSQLKHSWKNPYVFAMFERKTKCVLLNKILNILFLPFYQDLLELTPTLYCKRYKNLANLQFLRREELPNCLHLAHFPNQKNNNIYDLCLEKSSVKNCKGFCSCQYTPGS